MIVTAKIALTTIGCTALVLVVGCAQGSGRGGSASPPLWTIRTNGNAPPPSWTVRTNIPLTVPPKPLVLHWRGRVDWVNPKGFIILSFPIGSVPPADTHLNVYRRNVRVAEVKITPPQQQNLAAADIVSGECQVGDEARSE
jgi:hypothetical protein